VNLNGVRGPWVKHHRGLRQGDPLSPYLFILAIDTLQHILQKATQEGLLSPLRDRATRLCLSLYADVVVVFVNPDRNDVDIIMNIMQRFGATTGLKINKSAVAPICCSQIDLDAVLHSFGWEIVQFPINYVGLPLSLGRLRMNHRQPILDRASDKLSGWQGKLFNIGGCKELVKSVLSSLSIYLMTTIKPPKGFYKAMDKLRRRFLWEGS
jgi:hypothetical protein